MSAFFCLSSDLITVGVDFWTTGVVTIDCITFSVSDIGVFVVDTTGDGLILSVDSGKEVIPVFDDWAADGDCDRVCLVGVTFDGVVSDEIICGVEGFSIDGFEGNRYHQMTEFFNVQLTCCCSVLVVILPLITKDVFFDERGCFSSVIFGIFSLNDRLFDEIIRGLEGNRGTGETGGESKCWDLEKPPPPRVE